LTHGHFAFQLSRACAVRGRFYRPLKQAVSLRLEAAVVAWLKEPGKGYQTRANHILRERMLADMRRLRA